MFLLRNCNLVPGSWRISDEDENGLRSVGRQGSNFFGKDPSAIRYDLTAYFRKPQGEVPWQLNQISSTGDNCHMTFNNID